MDISNRALGADIAPQIKQKLALLQELIKFNHDGNFDRGMALMIGMYHTRELYNAEVKEVLEDRSADAWFESNHY